MTLADRIVIVVIDLDVDVVRQDIDDIGVRVGRPWSGYPQARVGLDPPEGAGIGMNETSVSGLAEVLDQLRRLATFAVAMQHPTASPKKRETFLYKLLAKGSLALP